MPDMGHLNYLPLTLPFFAILVAVFVVLVAFVEVGALRYAYLRLGVSPRAGFNAVNLENRSMLPPLECGPTRSVRF